MPDILTPVKDPTKNRFWRARNLMLLVATGVLPLIGTAFWKWATEKMDSFWSYDNRLRELEANAASDQAVWGALRDLTAKQAAVEHQLLIMQKLFDREWGRGAGVTENEYKEKLADLEAQLRDVRSVHRQLSILIGEHKAKNPGSKCEVPTLSSELPSIFKEPLDRQKRFEELGPPPPQPSTDWSSPLDREALKSQYERKFPAVQVPNQQKK